MFIPIYENNRFIPWESGQFSVNSTCFNTFEECLIWCNQQNLELKDIETFESDMNKICNKHHLFPDLIEREKFINDIIELVKKHRNDKSL